MHVPGGVYHVMLRGNNGEPIFVDDRDRRDFESLVADTMGRFDHRIHAYCWMPNHVHAVIQVGDDTLSRIIQNLAGRHTRRFNKRHGRVGHLFQGRFRALWVDADSYLLELVRYVHLNPVRAGLAPEAAAWPWSGHRAYLGAQACPWLTTDWVLGQFGTTLPVARGRYAEFIAEGVNGDSSGRFDSPTACRGDLAEDRFVEEVGRAGSDAPSESPDPDALIARVAAMYGLDAQQLASAERGHHVTEARYLAVHVAVATGIASLTEMSARFGRDVATLSNGIRRLRHRLGGRQGLDRRTQEVLAGLKKEKEKA